MESLDKTLVACSGCGQIATAVNRWESTKLAPGYWMLVVEPHDCPHTVPTGE